MYKNFIPYYNWQIEDIENFKGSFASERTSEYHTGIDIYCPEDTWVFPIESGVITNIEIFTGPNAGCPWYNETQSVLIEGNDYVFLYGEIKANPFLKVGMEINTNIFLGSVIPVLKKDKGNGTTMLHFEMYTKGTTKSVFWYKNQPMPNNLLNPTNVVKSIQYGKKV